ncbi:hypothetical protein P8452_12871 [Trifolium repens]|nr:hypothetical protein P8452_12871 [Trifolium repens]
MGLKLLNKSIKLCHWNSKVRTLHLNENSVTGLEFIRYEFGILASFGGITGAAQVSITGRQVIQSKDREGD